MSRTLDEEMITSLESFPPDSPEGLRLRHAWDYHGCDAYSAKHRTCKRCGVTARTFGVGAFRTWSYQSAAGVLLGSRTPPCTATS